MWLGKYEWIFYVVCAGLAWGFYVPLIFFGGGELGKPGPTALSGRLLAILCVGVAYFVLAVLIPLTLFATGQPWPETSTNGLVFSSLAGVAGALGAICVIFATRAAVGAAVLEKIDKDSYKLYIAPLIFGLAPVINTVVSSVWHPKSTNPFHFELVLPGWKLWLGIVLVGLGAALVLYSKEEAEKKESKSHSKSVTPVVASAAPTVLDNNNAIHTPGTIGDPRP